MMLDVLMGLLILARYYDDQRHFAAEHDQIWAGGSENRVTDPRDLKGLARYGWTFSEGEGWHRFI